MILHSWEKATSLHKFILLPRASLASTNSRISMFPFNSIRLRKIFTTLKLIFPLVRRSAGRNRCQIQSCLIAWRSTAYYVGMLAAYSVRRTIVHCGSDRKIRSLSPINAYRRRFLQRKSVSQWCFHPICALPVCMAIRFMFTCKSQSLLDSLLCLSSFHFISF